MAIPDYQTLMLPVAAAPPGLVEWKGSQAGEATCRAGDGQRRIMDALTRAADGTSNALRLTAALSARVTVENKAS